jgi:hypothetical protein
METSVKNLNVPGFGGSIDLRAASMMVSRVALVFLCVSCAWAATIHFDFEPPLYTGSQGGTSLTGQDNWYLGGGPGSPGGLVLTYLGNGLPVAPGGGTQFAAIIGPSAREQHDIDFSSASTWYVTFDVLAHSFGSYTSPVGTFTLVNAATYAYEFRADEVWDSTGNSWSMLFDVYDSTGNSLTRQDTGIGAFHGLSQDHWYQEQVVFDAASNRLLSVSMYDPGQAGPVSFSPTGWYLRGGASAPFSGDAILMYGGPSSGPGNGIAFDNIVLESVPEPATWVLVLPVAAALCCLRRRKL